MSLPRQLTRLVSIARSLGGNATDALLANLLAAAAALTAVGGVHRAPSGLIALAALVLMVWLGRAVWIRPWRQHAPAGELTLARLVVAIAAAMLVVRSGHAGGVLWTAVGLIILTTAPEAGVVSVANRVFDFVAGLPTYRARNTPVLRLGSVAALNTLATALLVLRGVWVSASVLGWLALVLALAAFAVEAAVVLDVLRPLIRGRQAKALTTALREYGPEFVLHWDAPGGTAYQVAMWLPYLERLGRPFFVLVRTAANFDDVRRLTSAPIVKIRTLEELDQIVVPTMRVTFYVNTATKNCHMIRYTQMKHVQLNHGDSDKVPSFNPVFRMFDRNFVAGQAAIDRFAANGVWVPQEMFEIVGRPQVSEVAIAQRAIGELDAPTVLYAPTWAGFYADSSYCSLPYGVQIVTALVARGCSVIFRPHPYTYRSAAQMRAAEQIRSVLAADAAAAGRAHVFGPTAETRMTIFECFNAADALISDVSSVPNDFLYSEKPFAMVAVSAPAERFADEFPVAKAAYVIDAHSRKITGLDDTLDALLSTDPLREQRRALKTYYLGDIPAGEYVEHFLATANKYFATAEVP